MEEPNDATVEFRWGAKRGVGGAKKDILFYESFTFDGVHYMLYDNVYLFKNDEAEPYIGKIIKIWEQSGGKKRVKILWFFEPGDILNCLGDYKPMANEIFLASGEGVGLANINPLEAISAKCSVICRLDDARNLQPSKNALDGAQHIFFRTFDVGKLTICEKLPDKIAGIEVKFLLNRKEDLDVGEVNTMTDRADEGVRSLKHKAQSETPIYKPVKKMRLSDDFETKQLSKEKLKSPNELLRKVPPAASVENTTEAEHQIVELKSRKESLHKYVSGKHTTKVEDRLAVTQKPDVVRPPTHHDTSGKHTTEVENQIASTRKPNVVRPHIHHEASGKLTTEVEHQIVPTRKPDVDRSKWFKALPWVDRLRKANQSGTLMLLQNFDRSLTSRDIEDIISHIFTHTCNAKVIPLLPPYHNPHYGQAYVIFKTQDAADETICKINRGCLMVQNRSALVASKGMLKVPEKPSTLTGHLVINKIKISQREEERKAVSTSHCSQPNTIEYEMALEWVLLQEKTITCLNQLYKMHNDEGSRNRRNVKSNM